MPTYADIRTALAAFDLAHDAYVATPSEETRCLREEAAALVIFHARDLVAAPAPTDPAPIVVEDASAPTLPSSS